MIGNQFTQMLQNYPDALTDRKRFVGLLKDFIPGQALEANLLTNLWDIGIHNDIEQTTCLDQTFSFRFAKRLCDEFGVSKDKAAWAVSVGVRVMGIVS